MCTHTPTLLSQVRAARRARVPLEVRARDTWTAAVMARHAGTVGRSLQALAALDSARHDPHPGIRALAYGCGLPGADPGPTPSGPAAVIALR